MAMMTEGMMKYIESQKKRMNANQNDKSLTNRIMNDLKRFEKYDKPQANVSVPKLKTFTDTADPLNVVPKTLFTQENADRLKTSQAIATPEMKQEQTPFEKQNTQSNFNYDPKKDERYTSYFKQPDSFSYDPKSDPMYQKMLQNVLNNSKKAQLQSLENLNERGIANSTIASNQSDQIAQDSVSQFDNVYLPQLMNQAYQRYQDGINNQRAMFDMDRGLSSDAYQRYMDNLNNQRSDKQLSMQEAGLTGTYNGQKTQDMINADRNFALQQAGLTGMYNGKQTVDNKIADRNYWLQQAGVTGIYQGKPTLDYQKLNEEIRNNKELEQTRALNADANLTRAETSKQKATNSIKTTKAQQRAMTSIQQQSFVKNSINPLLVDELGVDAFEFDYKTGRNVIKNDLTNQFVEVMKGIQESGLIDDNIVKLAFIQYGVPIPNGFLPNPNEQTYKDIMSFPLSSSEKSNTAGINPAYLK